MPSKRTSRRRYLHALGAAATIGVAGCASSGDDGASGTSTPANESTQTAEPTETHTDAAANQTTDSATEEPADEASSFEDLEGPRNGDDLPEETNPLDGYPPEFETVPAEREVKAGWFAANRVQRDSGVVNVPLVPADVAYYWYARGETRVVDARSAAAYDVSHVFGAVQSIAPEGLERNDPVADWPKSDRIVIYCDCPNYLSSQRAATLIENSYTNVYAIEEGYRAWVDKEYPMAGSDTDRSVEVRTISGQTEPEYADEGAWAYHEASGQQEASKIESDGSYELELRWVDVAASDEVTVETPGYTITDTLGAITSAEITADGELSTDGGSGNDSANALLRRLLG
ncbi:rhodanese-like domain-containing protein [Haloprofundus salinisoli]|uniref:rhodanese-like domain-containing protein n=1 Tax=Haloprofundus salinisoli TaxID=2876193 RepID=UPI001CCE0C15|nr:rhodanese-like domain-containing protein [Haloprofundus salinisoli]